MWSLGDYRELARQFEPTAIALVEASGIGPGWRCWRWPPAPGTWPWPRPGGGPGGGHGPDSPDGRVGSGAVGAEGLDIEWLEADAEELPLRGWPLRRCGVHLWGHVRPRPQVAAAELFRVVRSGGTVGLANWTPQGFLGRQIDLASSYAPRPPGGDPSPLAGVSLKSCKSA